jgi:hypothetical protein
MTKEDRKKVVQRSKEELLERHAIAPLFNLIVSAVSLDSVCFYLCDVTMTMMMMMVIVDDALLHQTLHGTVSVRRDFVRTDGARPCRHR